jgi:integrase
MMDEITAIGPASALTPRGHGMEGRATMQFHSTDQASGHLKYREGKRGTTIYCKGRVQGEHFEFKIGLLWTGRGKPATGYLTKSMAENRLREYLVRAQMGEVPAKAERATLEDAINEWLRYIEHDRKRKPSTVAGYRHECFGSEEHSIAVAFGPTTRLDKIDPNRVERFKSKLLEKGLSPRSINKRLLILNGIFKRAGRVWGVVNPLTDVELIPVTDSGDIDVLVPAEIAKLAAAAIDRDGPLFTVAAFTGLRMGELRALRWRDLDFDKQLVHVRRSYVRGTDGLPKSGKVRSVPMVRQAEAAFRSLIQREHFTSEDDLVFCNELGSYRDDARIRRRFTRALERAGLRKVRFHDLRHTFGTLAVQAFPLTDVKAYMGHADISTTMIYVHHVPRHDAADKLSAIIGNVDLPEPKAKGNLSLVA